MGVVPVSEAVRRLIENAAFWTGVNPLAADDGEVRASFPVAGGYGLVLDLGPAETALGLREPASSEPVQLGWAERGGDFPAALRWWELELCARVIALEDPMLPHPGLVVALLSPFAPATPDDDRAEIAAVREAAYRSLRRDVPDREPSVPEQAPLPLFADPDWWPAPEGESPQVLDEAAIVALSSPDPVQLEVRGGSRFPHRGVQELVRHAAARLSRQHHDSCYADALPLARQIVGSGDLSPVPRLLSTLTEAGCDHPTVLDALSEPLVPLEACWMVETLAGAEPGTLLRQHV
jgi:hypothetical protein